jgi:hypothetical protein
MIELITVIPQQDGWTVSHESEHSCQKVHSGATAEAIARQLGDALARAAGGRRKSTSCCAMAA